MKASRALLLIILLAIVAIAAWWLFSRHARSPVASQISIYYTKMDGNTEGTWNVSMRPQQPGESAREHLHNAVLYAAVQAVVGPPSEIDAIHFPPGTHVRSVHVAGSTALVDLSKQVDNGPGGTFAENGEFKALVYTLTALPGISAVQVTVDGQRLETLPGGHLALNEPLRRSDW